MRIFSISQLLLCVAVVSILSLAAHAVGKEFFLAAPPKDWVLGHKDEQADIATFQFIPFGETIQGWNQKVTVQKMIGVTDIATEHYLKSVAARGEEVCDSYQIQRLAFKDRNGYETGGIIQSCGNNKELDQGELTIFRVVRGEQNLYVIKMAWRLNKFESKTGLPLPKKTIDDTILYLASATVCNTSKGTCPAGMGK